MTGTPDPASPAADLPAPAPSGERISLLRLAAVHALIGLMSFGGGITALVYREVVIKRTWLTEEEFLSGLAIAQILPGVNVGNLAVYIGQRLRGLPGAAAALFGLLVGPFFLVIGFALLYQRIVGVPWVAAALDGVTAAAIGLMLMVAYRGARHAGPHLDSLFVLAATAIAVGVLRLPLLLVVLVMAPLSVALAYRRRRRRV